jgi:hypothetical protein
MIEPYLEGAQTLASIALEVPKDGGFGSILSIVKQGGSYDRDDSG